MDSAQHSTTMLSALATESVVSVKDLTLTPDPRAEGMP